VRKKERERKREREREVLQSIRDVSGHGNTAKYISTFSGVKLFSFLNCLHFSKLRNSVRTIEPKLRDLSSHS